MASSSPYPPQVIPVLLDGELMLTLRQIDELHALPKGSAFRAFKRVRGALVEGRDFCRLDAAVQGAYIERLREQRVVYASTVHLLVFSRSGYEQLRDLWAEYSEKEKD